MIFSKQNRLVSANWCHAWKILVKAFWLTSSAQLEITNELRKWHCLPCRPSHWDKGSRLSSSMLLPYWQLLLKSKSYTGRMPSSSKRGDPSSFSSTSTLRCTSPFESIWLSYGDDFWRQTCDCVIHHNSLHYHITAVLYTVQSIHIGQIIYCTFIILLQIMSWPLLEKI